MWMKEKRQYHSNADETDRAGGLPGLFHYYLLLLSSRED